MATMFIFIMVSLAIALTYSLAIDTKELVVKWDSYSPAKRVSEIVDTTLASAALLTLLVILYFNEVTMYGN